MPVARAETGARSGLGQSLHEVSISRLRNRSIAASGAALMIGAAFTWHAYRFTLASGFDLFPGPRGDTRLTAYLVEHLYQVALNRAHFLSPAMFYPVTGTLGYSDTNILYAPPYSILRIMGLDIFHALAVTVVLFGYLNFLSCYVLLNRILKCGVLASATGALFFAFSNPKLAQPDHLQLQPLFLLPVGIGLLLIFFRAPRHSSEGRAFVVLALAALAVDVQLLSAFYVGWFFLCWLVLLSALSLFVPDTRLIVLGALRDHRAAVIGGAIVFLVGLIPFAMVYLPAVNTVPWSGILPQYIAEPRSYLLLADGNYVWGRVTEWMLRAAGSGPDWGRRVGVGLTASLVWIGASLNAVRTILLHLRRPAAAGAAANEKPRTELVHLIVALVILATNLVVFAGLQYRGHTPWTVVYALVPGAKAIRAVARLSIVMALPMSIVFALATQDALGYFAQRRGYARAVLSGVLLIAITFGCLEQQTTGEGQYFSVGRENERLNRLSAQLPDDCAAFYVTAAPQVDDPSFHDQNSMHDAMLISVKRHVPTLNGRSGKNPPDWSLRDVDSADYEQNVAQWIRRYQLTGKVCRLALE